MEVLDLYSGTGALGFEAASRGASQVVFVEQQRKAAAQLFENKTYLLSKWTIHAGPAPLLQVITSDVLMYLKQFSEEGSRFDLVMIDPPFRSELMYATLHWIKQVLKPGGMVYAEWHENLFVNQDLLCKALNVQKIDLFRHLKAGQVHAHLFTLPAL
jgi:16S rRNA (guanine(966)-N(2))-methyltransferase RsmD